MCGIAGIISFSEPIEKGAIHRMVGSQRHRGPDDIGFFDRPFAHLGMCRLSILDLESEGLCPVVRSLPGKQPVVLVYNGEIYNHVELRQELVDLGHQFKTRCDAEVLLEAYLEWGEDCVRRLNGMFAFAIADFEQDLLFAARDRAGEKPFYYYHDSRRFLFASEIKAILSQIPMPEMNLTDEFRAFEYMTGEATLFGGVQALLPGHRLVLRGLNGRIQGIRKSEYWSVKQNLRDVNPKTAVDELDALLTDATRLRLRSDVPWGLYLSGGLDSSLLAYIARPPVCFTCHFPYGEKYDELEYAEQAARDIGAELIVTRPRAEDLNESLPDVMYHMDMPVGSFSMFPLFMLARTARQRVKIVLSGEGSDELFSGYTRYLILMHEQELFGHPSLRNYRPLLEFYYGKPLDRFARLLNRGLVSDDVVKSIIAGHFEQFEDPVHAMGYVDFKLMLVTLLHMEDRTAAAFGLENRSPFLDHRIIEFAFSIPADFKVRGLTPKWILREVARRYLPKEILERPHKMGLVAPINVWLHSVGPRGEFDRGGYNKLCMEKWLQVFYEQRRHLGPVPMEGKAARSV